MALLFRTGSRPACRLLPVSAAVAGWVRAVWIMDLREGAGGARRLVPDLTTELLVHLPDRGDALVAAVGSLSARPVRSGCGVSVGVSLAPPAARRVLATAMPELCRQPLLARPDLGEALAGMLAPSRRRSVAAWLDALLRLVGERLPASPSEEERQVFRALAVLQGGGPAPVGEIAAAAAVGERTLRRRFDAYCGIGIKQAGRLLRVGRALELAARCPEPNWADIALRTAHFDQAHLVHEVRRLAGMTPGQFHRRYGARHESDRFLQAPAGRR